MTRQTADGEGFPWQDKSGEEPFRVWESRLNELRAAPRFSGQTLLLYCSEGSATFAIDTEEYAVEHGCSLFIFPHKLIRVREAQPGFKVVCFAFCREILDEVASGISTSLILYIHRHPGVRLNRTDRSFIKAMAKQMRRVREDRRQPYGNKIVANILSNFLLIHYGPLPVPETGESLYQRSEELFKRFLTDVESDCTKMHSVTDYAARLCITPKHLTGITRAKTGKSPKEMIDEALLRRVRCSLKETAKSVKEISIESGFPNPAYFSRFFRRLTGMTPQEYRLRRST